MRTSSASVVFGSLIAIGGVGAAEADTDFVHLAVPGDFPTIQAAIDAAPKDAPAQVDIAPGVYAESLVISEFMELRVVGAPGVVIESTGGGAAIAVRPSFRVELSDLTLISDGVGIDVLGVRDGRATRVDIAHPASHGVVVNGTGFTPVTISGAAHSGQAQTVTIDSRGRTVFSISDSSIKEAGGDGVRVGAAAAFVAHRVLIVLPRDDGIHAEGGWSAVGVEDSTILDAGGDGVDVARAHLTVRGSAITACAGDGIRLSGSGGQGVVGWTRVDDVGGSGIETRDGAGLNWVSGNWVTRSRRDAIRVFSERVEDNSVRRSRGTGIVVEQQGAEVMHNRVANTRRQGIFLTGRADGAVIHHNVLSGCRGKPIDLGAATGVQVVGNTTR